MGFLQLAIYQLQIEGVDWKAENPKQDDPRLTVWEQYNLLTEAIHARKDNPAQILIAKPHILLPKGVTNG